MVIVLICIFSLMSGSISFPANPLLAQESGKSIDTREESGRDTIFLEGNIVLKGKIVQVTASRITYIPEGQDRSRVISREPVIKIVYADGLTLVLREKAVEEAVPGAGREEKRSKPLIFGYEPVKKPYRPRSVIWMPVLSFFLPGLDQWWEQQYPAAVFYTGTAVLGLSLVSPDVDVSNKQPDDKDLTDEERKSIYGAQLYQTAGSLSAYHCFRTAVASHRNAGSGRFSFLTEEETTGDILLAPFKLTFLARPTTFIPIGILSAVSVLALKDEELCGTRGREILFSSGISYNAGTGEEAVFRGWLMPLLMDYTGSPFWSNTITALAFAAAHISGDLRYPVAQFVAGWYFGWLTQRRSWTISESVFIHAWWDFILISTLILINQNEEDDVNIALPLFYFAF